MIGWDAWEAAVREELSDEAYRLCCNILVDRTAEDVIGDMQRRQQRVWALLQSACNRMLAASTVEEAEREAHRVRKLSELVPVVVHQRAVLQRFVEQCPDRLVVKLTSSDIVDQVQKLACEMSGAPRANWSMERSGRGTWRATMGRAELRVDEFTNRIEGCVRIGDDTWGCNDFKTIDDAERWCERSALAGHGVER